MPHQRVVLVLAVPVLLAGLQGAQDGVLRAALQVTHQRLHLGQGFAAKRQRQAHKKVGKSLWETKRIREQEQQAAHAKAHKKARETVWETKRIREHEHRGFAAKAEAHKKVGKSVWEMKRIREQEHRVFAAKAEAHKKVGKSVWETKRVREQEHRGFAAHAQRHTKRTGRQCGPHYVGDVVGI